MSLKYTIVLPTDVSKIGATCGVRGHAGDANACLLSRVGTVLRQNALVDEADIGLGMLTSAQGKFPAGWPPDCSNSSYCCR